MDLDELNAADEAEMVVTVNGHTTDWVWTFAGPGHPHAVAQTNRVVREALHRNRLKEQAQANNRKWKGEEQTPDELRTDNINFVLERLLGWSEVQMGGAPYPFSPENARKILDDRRKGALLQQAVEFLGDDNSFTPRSPKT
jgi:hypothetical protein